MAKQYRWRTVTGYQSSTTLSYGVTPNTHENWQTANVGDPQNADAGYWYRDSNTSWQGTFQDLLSSRAIYFVQQSWTSSVNDSTNVLTVVVNTKITSIQRDDVRHPTGYYDQDTPCRDIYIFDGATGSQDLHTQDCEIAQVHQIYGAVTFNTQTFVLAPGTSTATQTIEVHNQTTGGQSYDDIWIGVQFENTLPAPVTLTLNYNANGGSGAPSAQSVVTVNDSSTFIIPNTVPTRANYRFDGWCENSAGTGTIYHGGDTYTVSRSDPTKTLYAKWTPYWTATVTYNANGGTGAPAAQTASVSPDYNSKSFTVPSGTPTWGHYKFLGWSHIQYVDSRTDADVEYRAGDTVTVTKTSPSLTLYAVWMMDYRPGATLDTNTSVWKSHNRTNGACHVLSNTGNMTWQECRTIGGAEGDKGNPPLILTAANANSWRNQKLLGKE